jgi:predicted transcriptional regulator of viral defense system
LAARQHGVFSLAQLKDVGLTPRAAQKRALAGALHRVYRGVYSIAPPALLTPNGRYMAAVLACGPGALLSHRSAAQLHGLRRTDRSKIDVTVPGRRRVNIERIDVHTSQTLTAADTTTVDGIPCTSIARTIFDLSNALPRRPVERAMEQAEAERLLDLRRLTDVLERNRHARGAKVLAAILADYRGDEPTESDLEELLLSLCREAGLPVPERQFYIDPGDGEPMVRADFAWPTEKLIVEADSDRYHRTRSAFESDRRRDQRLMLAGWRVIRVTYRQLKSERRRIAKLIADVLRQPA